MNRKSNAWKEAQGTAQPCRMNPDELELDPGRPEPPEGLSGEALEHWERLANTLEEIGVLSQHDWAALAEMARCFSELSAVRRLIDTVLAAETPDIDAFNRLGVRRDALAQMYLRHLSKFGLTPSDRGSVVLAKPKRTEPNPWAQFQTAEHE